MNDSAAVSEHYEIPSLKERIGQALRQAGYGDGQVDWKALAPLDQFHVRGLASTQELSTALDVKPGATILDVGCGVGGASRFLAATYDAHVTGIDLTPSFVEAATMLSDRAGLADRTTFRVANALDLPFKDASFDYAWTQHVAMNIRDRTRLYAEIFRVLKPGGALAIHDVVQGKDEPLTFPLPWAATSEMSFLLSADGMRDALVKSGFEVVSWEDTTEPTKEWIAQLKATRDAASAPFPLGLHVVTGRDFATAIADLGRDLNEGRLRLIQTIVKRAT